VGTAKAAIASAKAAVESASADVETAQTESRLHQNRFSHRWHCGIAQAQVGNLVGPTTNVLTTVFDS
jgi:hypothetical protein